MSIQGNLETFYLSSLLQMLNYEKKTGRLKIKSKNNEVQIILFEGDIVFATETQKRNRIGMLLMNNGLIDQQVLDTCLDLSREKNQGIGKTLVQEGYITLNKLNTFLLKQAENTIYNVFLWESGEFEYNDAELNLRGVLGKKFNIMNIMLEASRRIDELAVLKKQIPDDQAMPKLTVNLEDNPEIKLNSEEWRVLSIINSNSTVRHILDQTGYDDFSGYKILNSLISSGKIEIRPLLSKQELAQQAVSQLKSIDARQFRETLDRIGLKRSSALRVSLTRIFRDAADKTQLMASVENEARKIVNPEEQNLLYQLTEKSRTPFMNTMLQLLSQSLNQMQ